MSGPEGALAERVAGIVADGAAPETLTAVQAAQRIRAWSDVLHTLSAVAEAQVMAAAWAIRREHPDRAAFDAFAARHLGGAMDPGRAWTLAETWDAARRNRGLRALAARRPDDAAALVREYADASAGHLDEDDRAVAEILGAAPRKRRAALRELRAAARAAEGNRHPGDLRRIRELEAERDAAEVRAGARGADPAALLAEDEKRLAARADEFDALRDRLSAPARDRLLRVADMAMGSIERIQTALSGGEDG